MSTVDPSPDKHHPWARHFKKSPNAADHKLLPVFTFWFWNTDLILLSATYSSLTFQRCSKCKNSEWQFSKHAWQHTSAAPPRLCNIMLRHAYGHMHGQPPTCMCKHLDARLSSVKTHTHVHSNWVWIQTKINLVKTLDSVWCAMKN